MRAPINEATLDLLLHADVEDVPERWVWLELEEPDRYVVIGEEVIDSSVRRGFGGCWPTMAGALASYDWNAGPPIAILDLFSPPEVALHDVILTPTTRGPRKAVHDDGETLAI